ncbi:MAG: hypothetical protein JW919_05440 [Candidatus Omnitrophica bacterium]|nr:hypothetical protein [Candidatus Omnitrophota bacterium]
MAYTTHKRRRGFALITSMLVVCVFIVLALPYVARLVTEYWLISKIYNSTSALYVAEAGADRALWEIRYNQCEFDGWTTEPGGDKIISVNSFQTSDGKTMGDYDVRVSISMDGMSAVVTATGYTPNRTDPDGKRTVKVRYSRHNFGKAVVALGGITMSGQAKTDSYDSNLGPYGSQPHTQEGDIITNGSISMSGQAYINGDAHPGPGHPFSGTPPVSGSYGTLQAPFTVDPIPASTLSEAQSNNNNDNILLDGQLWGGGYSLSASGQQVFTFPGGTYYFTSISTSGQAQINITGPSTIYVDGGNVSISGQGIVNGARPRDLLLYSSGSSISLSGQAAFTGAVYAPNANVTLSGQENVYGSIICGSNSDSGQAKIHFDLDLLNVQPVFANSRVTSWQEIEE